MLIHRLTVILRHNTTMPGDGELALREWAALIGAPGQPLNEIGLATVLPPRPMTIKPLLATAFEWVAVTWTGVAFDQAVALLRRSAFAQEVFLDSPDAPALLSALAEQVGSAAAVAERFATSVVVGLAHNYIIESEGALPAEFASGRLSAVVRVLLEPYRMARETALSQKLRAAKKTTLSLSHDLHIYKAKFFPRMIRALINIYGYEMAVFDPYCGSGTALLEAALLGQPAIGMDIDPICEMISNSKVTPFLGARADVREALETFRSAIARREQTAGFAFPEELKKMIARRDRIDGTNNLRAIIDEANILASAVRSAMKVGVAADLIRTLASDAVTKKIRYRFVGVGNGRYTIEIVKQSLLDRLVEKIERALQLLDVFADLEGELRITLGAVHVTQADARSEATWPALPAHTFVATSPPYLPASSGREHYASSRALAFAVLGFGQGEDGYFDNGKRADMLPSFKDAPESERLVTYLFSDFDADADPQRDAMRFERKAIPTAHYLADIERFGTCLTNVSNACRLAMVVAAQHTFYSHRRSEVEHIVDCAALYGEIMGKAGFWLAEGIELQLLKSSASRAKPRAKDDYHEAVLVFERAENSQHSDGSMRINQTLVKASVATRAA